MTITEIARLSGRQRSTVRNILAEHNMTKDDGRRAVAVCRKLPAAESPRHRKLAAQANIAERENRLAQKAEEERYVDTELVGAVARIIVSKLQTLPEKAGKELDLPPAAIKRYAELLEEIREELSRVFRTHTLVLPKIAMPAAA